MTDLNRRELLRAGAGAALGLSGVGALAGCGVSRNQATSKQATEKLVKAKIDGDLVYFNWSEYLDPGVIKAFEKRYGVKVRESNFDSMQGMMAKLRSGNRYDIIFPSSEWADRLIKANQLLRIDQEQLTNLGSQLYSPFRNPWYDPGAKHTVPYALYATGLIYRADRVKSMTGSWNDLKNPDAKGKTYLLDDFQEAIGAGNLVNGNGLNSIRPDQVKKSEQWLLGVKPNLRGISTDDVTNMTSGNAWIHHGWNGDVVNIRNQVKNPENFKFIKAKEGIPLGTDTFAIPANAPHPGTALTFINFILDPANLVKNVNYFGYPMPYDGAKAAFAALVKDDPAINVTTADLENGQQYRNLGRNGLRLWDQTWTDFKAS
ncbi:MAG: spermidine/putrescine transport system substrate-binding protein [Solirubrobacteraceae bacterium]|jgi:spermidine/putrescine transport system substrate-binding protein|nr:spermidine/putrescine transport system substrate-binding protein [Solirubrobacteraceae bacterium]